MWRQVVILILSSGVLLAVNGCPEQCSCTRTSADCSYAGLTTIPKKFPQDVIDINLRGNQLMSVSNGSFLTAPRLQHLDLSQNMLRSLEVSAFAGLYSLTLLNMSRNLLDVAAFRRPDLFSSTPAIKELDLSHNSLTTPPDEGIQRLTNLNSLYLQNNGMTSAILGPGFGGLLMLETIDMSDNFFHELKNHTFQKLQSLKNVYLVNCNIWYIGSELFTSISSLLSVDLSNNPHLSQTDLNATISGICNSPHLESVRLSNVNISTLSGMLVKMINTQNLKSLDLSNNHITRIDRSDLTPAKKLKRLNLSRNRLTEPNGLSLHYLEHLDLSHNSISDIQETHFEGVTDLTSLDMSYNQLTYFSSDPFKSLSEIESIDVSNNAIKSIGPITHLELLKHLNMKYNKITDPQGLFSMLMLETLDLGFNSISVLGGDLIPEGIQLKTLNLTLNHISSIHPSAFSKYTPKIIDLSYNKLRELEDYSWTFVEELHLRGNDIEIIRPSALTGTTWLRYLDLSRNELTSLPSNLFIVLVNLKTLILDDNSLGPIFRDSKNSVFSGQFSELEMLGLSGNAIESLYDNVFVNLTRLSVLDLSDNYLQSITAAHLKGLSLLVTLDLSNNNMSGFDVSSITSLVTLKEINLSGQPWSCDCAMKETKSWMESDSIKVQVIGYKDASRYSCASPDQWGGRPLAEYSGDCSTADESMEKIIIITVIGCTSALILIVAVIIFWQHRWRLKKKLKKQHYRAMFVERGQTPVPGSAAIVQTDYHLRPQHTHCPDGHHHHHHHSGGGAFV